MNRFQRKRADKLGKVSFLLPFLTFIPILLLFYRGILSITAVNDSEQLRSLEKALRQNIVHCYAVEGAYPSSLSYLEEEYGLTYDKQKFVIDYQPIGANILPDVTIIQLEAEEEQESAYEIAE